MMLTILIFSFVFAHSNLSRKDPQDYKCHVENALGISGSIRSLNIILQAPGTAATKGKLTRTPKVITLECFHFQTSTSVKVNVLYSKKVDRSWTNRTVEKCTLQSLEVVTSPGKKPAVGHTCVLLTRHRKLFQRNYILREKERTPSTNDKNTLNRQKLIITVKVAMVCILLASIASSVMLVIYEIPCLYWCPDWLKTIRSRNRIPAATWVPAHDRRATFLTPFLKGREREPLKASA